MIVNILRTAELGGTQPGGEIVDSARNVGERVLKRLLAIKSHRIRNGPVDALEPRQLLVGVIADGDHQVFGTRHVVDQAGLGAPKVQAVAAGNIHGTGCHMFGRMRSRRNRWDVTSRSPQSGSQLRAGAIAGAHK